MHRNRADQAYLGICRPRSNAGVAAERKSRWEIESPPRQNEASPPAHLRWPRSGACRLDPQPMIGTIRRGVGLYSIETISVVGASLGRNAIGNHDHQRVWMLAESPGDGCVEGSIRCSCLRSVRHRPTPPSIIGSGTSPRLFLLSFGGKGIFFFFCGNNHSSVMFFLSFLPRSLLPFHTLTLTLFSVPILPPTIRLQSLSIDKPPIAEGETGPGTI